MFLKCQFMVKTNDGSRAELRPIADYGVNVDVSPESAIIVTVSRDESKKAFASAYPIGGNFLMQLFPDPATQVSVIIPKI
jgi:hypothetical protein